MKRPIVFITYFPSFCHIAHVHKIFSYKNFQKKASSCFKRLMNYYSSPQLSASFMTKLMKKPCVFITDMQSSYKLPVSEKFKVSCLQVLCNEMMTLWKIKKICTRTPILLQFFENLRSFGLALLLKCSTFWLKFCSHLKKQV